MIYECDGKTAVKIHIVECIRISKRKKYLFIDIWLFYMRHLRFLNQFTPCWNIWKSWSDFI